MATVAVKQDGSGDYTTITAAVAGTSGGDIIEIQDSNQYNEDDIEILGGTRTIRAGSGVTPIIDGDSTSGGHAFETYSSGNVFQGLIIRNYTTQAINGQGAVGTGRNFKMVDCTVYGYGGPQSIAGGLGTSNYVEIERCKFIADSHRALNIVSGQNIFITNCFLATNDTEEAVLLSSKNYPNVTASHCTMIGQGDGSGGGRHYHLVTQVAQVDNCIVQGTYGHGIQAETHYNNLVYVTDTNAYEFVAYNADSYNGTAAAAGTGDIAGSSPLFVGTVVHESAYPGLDINLQTSSPAVDAGSSSVTLDLSGSTRDSSPDIGALEFIALGYANTLMGVAAGNLGKILDISKANVSKVIGT